MQVKQRLFNITILEERSDKCLSKVLFVIQYLEYLYGCFPELEDLI